MLAGAAGVDGELVVELVPEHDGDRVDVGIRQEFVVGWIALGDVVLVHVLAPLLLEQIGNRDDFHLVEMGD